MVVLLKLHGIQARKWALYSSAMKLRHAAVQVETEKGKMVIDPLFDLCFPRPGGGYYGIEDLRHDPSILRARVLALRGRPREPNGPRIEWYPLDVYTYQDPRTINWDKTWWMRLTYGVLKYLIGDSANRIPQPGWTTQPALMFLYALGAAEAGVLLLWLLIRHPRRKRAS